MVDFTINFEGLSGDFIRRFGLEDHGRVQMAIDKAVIDYSMAYWAFDTGTLARSAYTASDIGSGKVIYPGPYAHYQFYGEVYGPNIPIFEDDSGVPTGWFSPPGKKKHPTGRKLQYKTDRNPLAGAFPVERMKADHIHDIEEEALRVALGEQHS